MPITKTVTLYTYDELPTDKAKEKAREWMSEGEAELWEASFDSVETAAAILGITFDDREVGQNRKTGKKIYRPDISYSGFYSPGDGASFTGRYEFAPGCATAIREEFPTETRLHEIADSLTVLFVARRLLGKSGISAKITQSGNYCHANTMALEWAVSGDNEDEEVSEAEEDKLLEAMRDFANWIYDGLKQDYEWRLEDEQLIDALQANEYRFTEDGERED